MASTGNNKLLNNTQSKNLILREAISLDAPPLDFSYKNIKELADLKMMDPRGGKRKPIVIELEETKNDKKKKKEISEGKQENIEKEKEEKAQSQYQGNEGGEVVDNASPNNKENQKVDEKNENEEKDKEKDDKEKDKEKEKEKDKNEENQIQQPAQQNVKKGPEIIRVIPQNNIANTIAAHNIILNNANAKNMVGKNFEETNIYSQKKVVSVKLVCTSLILSYNEIRTIEGIYSIIDTIMYDCHNLAWIDLSHNYLVNLAYNFKEFPFLRTFYLHCNYIKDLKEILHLKDCKNLKSLTIHGNPVETINNFRIYMIGILPYIKKIDTVLVSKKERDNAYVWITSFKNVVIPELKNAIKPPEIVQVQQDQK